MSPNRTGRSTLQNVSWLLSERVLRTLVGFVVSTAVARHLGPGELGILSLAQSLVFVAAGVSALGLDATLVPELVREPGARDGLLGTALALRVAVALLSGVFVVGLSVLANHAPGVRTLVAILALGNVLDSLSIVDQYFIANIQAGAAVRARMFTFLVCSALRLGMVFTDADVQTFAWIQAGGSLLQAIGYLAVYSSVGHSALNWRFRREHALSLLKVSWPIAVSGLVFGVQMRADQVLMGSMLSAEVLGSYSLAVRLTETLGVLPAVISSVMSPLVAQAHAKGSEFYEHRLLQLHQMMFATGFATAVPMALFGPWAVVAIFGQRFELAGTLFALYAIRLMFAYLGSGRYIFQINEGLSLLSLGNMTLSAVINLGCNLLLIPRYGAYGAVAAMAISNTIPFLQDWFHPRMKLNLRQMARGAATFWKVTAVLRDLDRR